MARPPSSPILAQISQLLNQRGDEVLYWLQEKQQNKHPFIYSSVDLRHSGFKLSAVDTNLFPAGFNQLSALAKHRAVAEFRHYFRSLPETPKRVLIIPENHTRNLYYLENLHVLSSLVAQAGMEVRIGSLAANGEPVTLQSASGADVVQWPLERRENRLRTSDGFDPDLILLNNDFTGGPSAMLENIEQPCLPPMQMGWYRRRKSEHFSRYCKLTAEFGEGFGMDSWLLRPHGKRVGIVDFSDARSLENLASVVDEVLKKVRDSYGAHHIRHEPYVFVKADSGTYGMGILTAKSGDELLEINKKTRNKMKVIKEGAHNTEVLVQEGIPTVDKVGESPAEPMVYLVGGSPIGGAYRYNTERDSLNNLNANGMAFAGMCDEGEIPDKAQVPVADCNFGAFGLVARIASLAATYENYTDFEYAI